MSHGEHNLPDQAETLKRLLDHLRGLTSDEETKAGATPYSCIYRENKLRLRRYDPVKTRKKPRSILLVYALVNRPDITDLDRNRSLIRGLLACGYRVYLIDWGYPDSTDRWTGLNDYINGYLDRCLNRACGDANDQKMTLLGICQGGTMSLCYSALNPDNVERLITLVTPVDFHAGSHNLLADWVDSINLEEYVAAFGNISGDMVTRMFKNMKPYLLNREKYRQLNKMAGNPEQLNTFLKMERWIHDSPDLAGKMAREYGLALYQNNELHKDRLELGGQPVRLNNIHCPVLNIFADQDHIVPPDSSRALSQHLSGKNYEEVCLHGGHIGVFTSSKTLGKLTETIHDWMSRTA